MKIIQIVTNETSFPHGLDSDGNVYVLKYVDRPCGEASMEKPTIVPYERGYIWEPLNAGTLTKYEKDIAINPF